MGKRIKNEIIKIAAMSAIIYLFTMTGAFVQLPEGAYIHIGDSMIYIAALVFPIFVSLPAAVIGTVFADITLGSTVYIIPTLIIKALTLFAAKALLNISKKPLAQDMLVCLAGIVTVAGYYVADVIILVKGGITLLAAALGALSDSVPVNILQALASAVLYLEISGVVRKRIKTKATENATQE